MKNQFVLFDFDGVIADTFAPAFEVHQIICPGLTEEMFRKRFEGNINNWEDPSNFHTDSCRHDIDFFTEYLPRMKKRARLVPGIKEVIRDLATSYKLVIASSNLSNPVQEFLETHELAPFFLRVMGNDVHKSKVEKLKMIFQTYALEPHDCVFVTDTLGDILEARHANVETVAVEWGFHTSETLLRGNPFRLIHAPEELPTVIADYFQSVSP